MENSPLRFLDNDVSHLLCEQVRLSSEEEARKFHGDLYQNGKKKNKIPHELIVSIFSGNFFGKYRNYITNRVGRYFPMKEEDNGCIRNWICRLNNTYKSYYESNCPPTDSDSEMDAADLDIIFDNYQWSYILGLCIKNAENRHICEIYEPWFGGIPTGEEWWDEYYMRDY